jgi:hypothetical protein
MISSTRRKRSFNRRSSNICRRKNAGSLKQTFEIDTTPNAQQRTAFDLSKAIRV